MQFQEKHQPLSTKAATGSPAGRADGKAAVTSSAQMNETMFGSDNCVYVLAATGFGEVFSWVWLQLFWRACMMDMIMLCVFVYILRLATERS